MANQKSGVVVGIDLGTTNSAIAFVPESGRPEIIPSAEGHRLVPSVIYFGPSGPVVGEHAKSWQAAGEENTAAFFKRYMGDSSYALTFGEKTYDAVALSSLVLEKLKKDAEARLGQEVNEAVITVPAYFNHLQRESTVEAARRCGLRVSRLINEPTAAALSYGVSQNVGDGKYLVYDLGGGTFDVTILEVGGDEFTVLSTGGDSRLGGKDWDDRVLQFLASRFKEEFGVDPLEDRQTYGDLLVEAEIAKCRLSALESTQVSIRHEGLTGRYELTRSTFEDITSDLMERTRNLTEGTLDEASLGWKSIAGVILVGGSTRMPMVRRYVTELSGKQPAMGVNPDEAVALGAAIQAALDAMARGVITPQSPTRFLPSARTFH
ncbi:MAG: Hsp70 family protein, partial [Chloroflexi bacterium]|nr:Hsp70 family protein [Chloroflexota bacterium]